VNILQHVNTFACIVLTVCCVAHMNHMTPRTPVVDIFAWWCGAVGSFAHAVYSPERHPFESDASAALGMFGVAIILALQTWPRARGFLGPLGSVRGNVSPCEYCNVVIVARAAPRRPEVLR
jgi:hypothetical protein